MRRTLSSVKENNITGSSLIADTYAEKFVNGSMVLGMKHSLAVRKITDEELDFALDFSNSNFMQSLVNFLSSEDLELGETYFLGEQTEKGPFMSVVEIILGVAWIFTEGRVFLEAEFSSVRIMRKSCFISQKVKNKCFSILALSQLLPEVKT